MLLQNFDHISVYHSPHSILNIFMENWQQGQRGKMLYFTTDNNEIVEMNWPVHM